MEIYVNKEHLYKQIEYPDRYVQSKLLNTAVVVFVFVLLFLLLFMPFGVTEHEQKMNYFFISGVHALLPSIIIYCYFSMFNYVRARLGSKGWSLLYEYTQICIVLLLTGIASFLMRDIIYTNSNNWSWGYLFEEVRNCLLAGSIFYFIFRIANFYFQSKKGDPFVLQFLPFEAQPIAQVSLSMVFIKTQVKQDDFTLCLNDLLFVKAEGNYIELTSNSDGKIITELKRISLSQFALQVAAHPFLFRCHRAYLVNMLKIENVSGNASGYTLVFKDTDEKLPVSRAQLSSFNIRYKELQEQHSI